MILNPKFDQNDQMHVEMMVLAKECLKSYPKRPTKKEIRAATETERISMLANIYARQKENRQKTEAEQARRKMDVEKLM